MAQRAAGFKIHAQHGLTVECADLVVGQRARVDAHIVEGPIEVVSAEGATETDVVCSLEGCVPTFDRAPLALDKDSHHLLLFVVTEHDVIPDIVRQRVVAGKAVVVEPHVQFALIETEDETFVRRRFVSAKKGLITCGSGVGGLDPRGDGEAAIFEAQRFGVRQHDGVVAAVKGHAVVEIARLLPGRAAVAPTTPIARGRDAGVILELGHVRRFVEGQPELGEARLLTPIGDNASGNLRQADGAGGHDGTDGDLTVDERFFLRMQDKGLRRDGVAGEFLREVCGEQALRLAAQQLIGDGGLVIEGCVRHHDEIVGIIARVHRLAHFSLTEGVIEDGDFIQHPPEKIARVSIIPFLPQGPRSTGKISDDGI